MKKGMLQRPYPFTLSSNVEKDSLKGCPFRGGCCRDCEALKNAPAIGLAISESDKPRGLSENRTPRVVPFFRIREKDNSVSRCNRVSALPTLAEAIAKETKAMDVEAKSEIQGPNKRPLCCRHGESRLMGQNKQTNVISANRGSPIPALAAPFPLALSLIPAAVRVGRTCAAAQGERGE